jgi:hypothetical protein
MKRLTTVFVSAAVARTALAVARAALTLAALAAAGIGCSPVESGAQVGRAASALNATVTAPPTLTFDAHFGSTQTARLIGGGQAVINFDGARLPNCRDGGQPGDVDWHLQAQWNVDGKYASAAELTVLVGGGRAAAQDREIAPTTITLPVGNELEIWFANWDAVGCINWDSDYGANYKFSLNGPLLDFNNDWTVTTDGPLIPGQTAVLRYDDSRLQTCRLADGDDWDLYGMMSVDGGAPQKIAVTADTSGVRGRVDVPIVIPSGKDLAFWFVTTNDQGCSGYDSDYGKNFHFVIQQP